MPSTALCQMGSSSRSCSKALNRVSHTPRGNDAAGGEVGILSAADSRGGAAATADRSAGLRSVRGFGRHFGRFKCAVPGASRTRAQLLASDSGPRALGSGVCARCVEQHEQQKQREPEPQAYRDVLSNNQPAESWPCEAELGGARFFIDIVSQSLLFNSLIAASVHSNPRTTPPYLGIRLANILTEKSKMKKGQLAATK